MKGKTIWVTVVVVLVFLVAVAAYSSNSSSALVGEWRRVEGSKQFKWMDFYKDGTYASNDPNYNGDYTYEDGRLKLTGILVPPLTINIKFSNGQLILLNSDGESAEVLEKR